MKSFLALLICALTAGVTVGIQPAAADHVIPCDPGHQLCINMGASQAWGSVSGQGWWQSQRQAFINKLAMCDKIGRDSSVDRDSYVEMFLMVRIFPPDAAEPKFIDVPAGNQIFRVREDDPKCVTVAKDWTVASSAAWEQFAMIEKYRQVEAFGEFGEVTAAGPWHYTNWDYNPYASCPRCLPPDPGLP